MGTLTGAGCAASPARRTAPTSSPRWSSCVPTCTSEVQTSPPSRLGHAAARLPLIVGIGLAVFQQVTGINTVIYFAPDIFQASGLSSASAAILATAGFGVVNVVMTMVAIWLVDRVGRRVLLLWGLAGMGASLCLLALGFVLGHGPTLG